MDFPFPSSPIIAAFSPRFNVNEKFSITSASVPFLIIGKETIIGFNSSKEESILNSIKSAFESTDRYDVLKNIMEE